MAANTKILLNKYSIQEVSDDDSHWIIRKGNSVSNNYIEMWYWGRHTFTINAQMSGGYCADITITLPVQLGHVACMHSNITDIHCWSNIRFGNNEAPFKSIIIRAMRHQAYTASNTYTLYGYIFGEPV